jgi:hypothetical protein
MKNFDEALLSTLGPADRMIAASKSRYATAHPTNVPVFNANVCLSVDGVSRPTKRWFGDLDLTVDEPLLVELARQTGSTVYVLYERDARFATAKAPLVEAAVYSVTPTGETHFNKHVERSPDGKLRLRRRSR